MKVQLKNYTFNAASKVITFPDFTTVDLDSVLLITNVSTNEIIYNFANPTQGGTVNGNQLTLIYDTTSMLDSHDLQIYYDINLTPSSDEAVILLRRIAQALIPIATQDANQRQRITLDAISGGLTLSALSTVSTVSNVATLAGVDSRYQFIDAARNAYANGIRQNLTFS